jgi:Zn-dependent oligopeptidase
MTDDELRGTPLPDVVTLEAAPARALSRALREAEAAGVELPATARAALREIEEVIEETFGA